MWLNYLMCLFTNMPFISECEKNVLYGENVVGSTEGMASYTACQDYCKDQYSAAQYIGYLEEQFMHLNKGLCICQSALDENNKFDVEGYVAGSVNCVVAGK